MSTLTIEEIEKKIIFLDTIISATNEQLKFNDKKLKKNPSDSNIQKSVFLNTIIVASQNQKQFLEKKIKSKSGSVPPVVPAVPVISVSQKEHLKLLNECGFVTNPVN